MSIDLNILVGGEAGQGIQTIGFVLGKTMTRGGFTFLPIRIMIPG
jgi:2-oxoglutarate ferredoxin oxidoreductase subunit alpha